MAAYSLGFRDVDRNTTVGAFNQQTLMRHDPLQIWLATHQPTTDKHSKQKKVLIRVGLVQIRIAFAAGERIDRDIYAGVCPRNGDDFGGDNASIV
jgi:hypothetical protein